MEKDNNLDLIGKLKKEIEDYDFQLKKREAEYNFLRGCKFRAEKELNEIEKK